MRDALIRAGFSVLGGSGLHRLAAPRFRGLGGILMMHHVRPYRHRDFEPNRLLEITPDFLDAALGTLRRRGYRILKLDDAIAELRDGGRRQATPFAVLTFDDGYRDNLVHALPVLERHEAPFTVYVTTGFADRRARLWWIELEEAVRRASRIDVTLDRRDLVLPAASAGEKRSAYARLYWALRAGPEDRLLGTIAEVAATQGVIGRDLVEGLCLDWSEIETLARHPLATVGAHTVTHARLAKLDDADMRTELGAGRTLLEERLGRPVVHLAYPVGDRASAGPREFTAAAAFGYASAVTTRPGVISPGHRDHPTALPRVSVNGLWQDVRHLEVLLSGAAFALWNRGRSLDVG